MLPAEEIQALRAEQAKLREDYGELPPRLDAARIQAREARSVLAGLQEPLAQKRAELEDLERRWQDAESQATLAASDEQDVLKQQEQMETRDEEITTRVKELQVVLNAPAPEPEAAPVSALLEAAERFGQFSARDLAVTLKQSPKATQAAIDAHVNDGRIRDLKRKVMGQSMYEHVGAAQDRKDEEAESVRLVRDFVVVQKEPFSPSSVTEVTEVEGQELVEALQSLIVKGTITYVGFDDLELYEYVKPAEMGSAAEKDVERRKSLAKTATTTGSGGGGPVPGTSKGLRISDPDVRALAQQIEAAGGVVETGPRGGHFIVSVPGRKRKIPISSTPSSRRSVHNDRARVRRELGLNI
jgi:hypothetical protein